MVNLFLSDEDPSLASGLKDETKSFLLKLLLVVVFITATERKRIPEKACDPG